MTDLLSKREVDGLMPLCSIVLICVFCI